MSQPPTHKEVVVMDTLTSIQKVFPAKIPAK
jgi:hypothetical protein